MNASKDGPAILVEREGPVMRVTLNRPSAGNAITRSMAHELMQAVTAAEADPAVRCVLVTGQGKYFCVGGDLGEFPGSGPDLRIYLRELTTYLHAALSMLLKMEKPLVTAINGPVAGGGLGLALLGDVVIAAQSSHFTTAYRTIGVTPDGGSTWILPRLVGLRRAQDMLISNKRITANEAVDIGLVSRTVEDGALSTAATEVAQELAHFNTFALSGTRKLLLSSYGNSPEAQMELESNMIAISADSAGGQEGIQAFLGKRKPKFH
ncbi:MULTISPECIES: enoyl-CoA hydratase/isomerase family protein [unclassified Xanthobacter]|uniref:enoyl-CoA hydratase/isomerase family protein n=1 Tax=unclassified Xanthobacter TaxID=2623496 RepID=UPI001EE0F8C4|nr:MULTISPECIES: enoyl-CoA hydratase/isomerase family protein [unclassified Xanthobacter]